MRGWINFLFGDLSPLPTSCNTQLQFFDHTQIGSDRQADNKTLLEKLQYLVVGSISQG
jgi:hypothetical protein